MNIYYESAKSETRATIALSLSQKCIHFLRERAQFSRRFRDTTRVHSEISVFRKYQLFIYNNVYLYIFFLLKLKGLA